MSREDEIIAYIEKAIYDERFAFVTDDEQAQMLLNNNPSLRLFMKWDNDELEYILPEFKMKAKFNGPNGPVQPGVLIDEE